MARSKFVIVVGASAGGTVMLPTLLQQLSPDMNIAVFVAVHLSKKDIGELVVKRLQKHTELKCKIPSHHEKIMASHVYISKPDHHLMITKNDEILVGRGPMENRYRPSIDALFRSAAVAFKQQVIGIILSGMLEDGSTGMQAIKKTGGTCIIQDPDEAQYPDMPKAVIALIKPDYSLPVEQMGEAIATIIRAPKKRTVKVPEEVIKEAAIAEKVHTGIDQMSALGERSPFSCPDCGGSIWEIKDNGMSRYRCQVGHAYTEESLLATMEASTESALWTALRIIEERKGLLQKLGEKEAKNGNRRLANSYKERVSELDVQIRHLKQVLFNLITD